MNTNFGSFEITSFIYCACVAVITHLCVVSIFSEPLQDELPRHSCRCNQIAQKDWTIINMHALFHELAPDAAHLPGKDR